MRKKAYWTWSFFKASKQAWTLVPVSCNPIWLLLIYPTTSQSSGSALALTALIWALIPSSSTNLPVALPVGTNEVTAFGWALYRKKSILAIIIHEVNVGYAQVRPRHQKALKRVGLGAEEFRLQLGYVGK